jgi:hypothetical protein
MWHPLLETVHEEIAKGGPPACRHENTMSTKWKIDTRCALREFMVLFFAWCALVTSVMYGQGQNQRGELAYGADKTNVSDAINKVKSGNFALVHIELIAKAHAVEAIPTLEEQFARSQDARTKAKIASALVRLGTKDDIYWDFLVEQATLAVESPAPSLVDSQGKIVREQLSPEFLAWAKAHNVPPDPVYGLPGNVVLLGETEDPRGIPLLRRGLLSPNSFIEVAAAKGLAQIQDTNSIPLIIEACQRSPEAALALAEALVYFDDSRAQSAVDTYMPKDLAKVFRESKAQGKKPFGY